MKKTTQIHIGGRHFFIDEDAYVKLNHYLEALKTHFSSENETGKEIVEDIEQRIAELLDVKITNGRQSIAIDDVNEIIHTLGKVEDFEYNINGAKETYDSNSGDRKNYRRFFRDPDNYYFGGVASGLGEYFDIDPLWIRLAFVFLTVFKGAGLLIYLILWIVVPKARTTTEKLQMKGRPVNLHTIKNSVTEEFEKVKEDGTYSYRSRNAFENIMRAIALVIVAFFKFFLAAIGILFMVIGSVFLAGLIMFLFGFTNIFGHFPLWHEFDLPNITGYFTVSSHYYLVIISLIVLVLIPVAALIYGGVKILFDVKSKHPILRAFLLTSWILALILFVTLIIYNMPNSPIEAKGTDSLNIDTKDYPAMYINVQDNLNNRSIISYRIIGYRFNYSKWDKSLYTPAELSIKASRDDRMYIAVEKRIKNIDMFDSDRYIDRINYWWEQKDSAVYLDKYFDTDDDDFWMFPQVSVSLYVPENQAIIIDQETCEMLDPRQSEIYCRDNDLLNKKIHMSHDGTLLPVK